jgi:hypothetical protein
MTNDQHTDPIEREVEEFRRQFDELGLKPPKNSMPGLERELIIDYWRKVVTRIQQETERKVREEVQKELVQRYWLKPERSKKDVAKDNAWNDLGNTLRKGV